MRKPSNQGELLMTIVNGVCLPVCAQAEGAQASDPNAPAVTVPNDRFLRVIP